MTPRIFWDLKTESTVFAPNNSYTGYSRLIQLNDGRLLAVVENSGIKIAFSDDKGATWHGEKRIVFNPSGIAECVPDLLQLADGSIIVGYNPRPSAPYSVDRKFGIRAKRSTDGGATWSNEIYIYDASHDGADGCWEPHFIQLPSGELQCYFADESPYTSSGEQQISVCRSFDNGITWSKPECVSFRPGNRDGMPAAILLEDPDEIVVIVEDNGWYGNMGNFTPTTVRCPLSTNWHNYHVGGAEDSNRDMIYTFTPWANMAAPYIRKVSTGYTVASCQGLFQRTQGQHDMFVAVGDRRARNFERLSRPFSLPENRAAMWNSLAIIDDSVVVAVAGIDGIRMIKGYPKSEIAITSSKTVNINGSADDEETFSDPSRRLIPMGTTTRNDAAADMAYDDDYFYFTITVADKKVNPEGDIVTLYLDPANLSTGSLAKGLYRFTMSADGKCLMSESLGRAWSGNRSEESILFSCTTSGTGYCMELAVPWSLMGLDGTPADNRMRFALEITDAETGTDDIPDVNVRRSESWMPILLADNSGASIMAPQPEKNISITVSDGTVTLTSSQPVERMKLLAMTGITLAETTSGEMPLTLTTSANGPAIVSVIFKDHTTLNRKIIL